MAVQTPNIKQHHPTGKSTRPLPFGAATSVYLSKGDSNGVGGWLEFRVLCEQKLGCTGSFRLNTLMLKDLAELKGMTVATVQNIGTLEMQVATLIHDGKKLCHLLKKVGVYYDLADLAVEWHLDWEDFHNADSVIGKFLEYKPLAKDKFTRETSKYSFKCWGKRRRSACGRLNLTSYGWTS